MPVVSNGGPLVEPDTDESDHGLPLKRIVEILWLYRRTISAAVLGVAILSALVLLAAVLLSPSDRLGSIPFRLTFEGAADGKYPNGLSFSSAEIIGAPILNEVVRVNDLERYGGYQALRDSLFLLQSNPELQLMSDEYLAKLADTKLAAVDRTRLEDEFRRKRESLKDPTYTLSMRRNERVTRMPAELIEKTLNETLSTWATQAIEQKGAAFYNVPVLSRNVLRPEALQAEDYIVEADILRVTAIRILTAAGLLNALPGAPLIRTGKEQISLAEIKANLEDILRFEVEPLIQFIRAEGLTKDPQGLLRYVSGQLFQLKLRRDAATARLKATQDALQAYSGQRTGRSTSEGRTGAGSSPDTRLFPGVETQTTIPQLGEGFLDRLMQLTTQGQSSDRAYRQQLTEKIIADGVELSTIAQEFAFYEGLETSLKSPRASTAVSADLRALVSARLQHSLDSIGVLLDRIVSFHRDLSRQNLTPAILYTVSGPFTVRTVRALPIMTAAWFWLLALMATVVLVPAGCLVHHVFHPKKRDTTGEGRGRSTPLAPQFVP